MSEILLVPVTPLPIGDTAYLGVGLAIQLDGGQRDQPVLVSSPAEYDQNFPLKMTFGEEELEFSAENPPEPDLIVERLLARDQDYLEAIAVEHFLESATDAQIRTQVAQIRAS